MKQLIKIVLSVAVVSLIFISCDNIYISKPQPVDTENIYTFPKKFRGMWLDGEDTVIVDKNTYLRIAYREKKAAMAVIDTSSSFLLKNNKIYLINKDNDLKIHGGFAYTVKDDTCFYRIPDITEINLGRSTFLRKVNNYYFINYKNDNHWWFINLIEKTNDGGILVTVPNLEHMENVASYDKIYSFEYDHYIEAEWTSGDMLNMVVKDVFIDTFFYLDPRNKLK